jgi:hypothetical protein
MIMKTFTLITWATLTLMCFPHSLSAQGLMYVSNLGDPWTEGGIGDIHALFPGGTPYGTDTADFITGVGNGFAVNSLTLEFDAIAPSEEWENIIIQLYQQTGNLLLGSFGNPVVNSTPTQWPGSTTFIDFSPSTAVTLNPSSQYYVVVSVPVGSPTDAALLFTQSSAYTTPTDWSMGATTAGNPYANGEYLVLAIDATSVSEPNTVVLLLFGGFIVQIGCYLFRRPNTALEPTPTAP